MELPVRILYPWEYFFFCRNLHTFCEQYHASIYISWEPVFGVSFLSVYLFIGAFTVEAEPVSLRRKRPRLADSSDSPVASVS